MNEKPSFKQIAIINIVSNIPMALIMSTVAPIIGEQKIEINNWIMNVVIAFVINAVVPIPLIEKNSNIVQTRSR